VKRDAGAILLAAGQGRRLGHDKSITEIAGRPVFAHPMEALLASAGIGTVVLTVRTDVKEDARRWVDKHFPNDGERVKVIEGGKERQDSVWEGLGGGGEGVEWAVVHDAARVLLTKQLVERVLSEARRHEAAAAASKMSDTVRATNSAGQILRWVDREGLWRMETPQVVRKTLLQAGLKKARKDQVVVTDCLAAAELAGVKGVLVESGEPNLKITVSGDWVLSEAWLRLRK